MILLGITSGAFGDPPDYRLIDLGLPRGTSGAARAHGINRTGEVVGVAGGQAFVWFPAERYGFSAGMHHVSDLLPNSVQGPSRANDINDFGLLVGQANSMAHFWDLGLQTDQSLGTLGGTQSEAFAINNPYPPMIVGDAWRQDSSIAAFRVQLGGSMVELDCLGEYPWCFARGVANPVGSNPAQIVGWSNEAELTPCLPCQVSCKAAAVEWVTTDPTPQPLGVLPPIDRGGGDQPYDINDAGNVVGVVGKLEFAEVCPGRAAFWEDTNPSTTPVVLPTEPGGSDLDATRANAIAEPFADGILQAVGLNVAQERAVRWTQSSGGTWTATRLDDLSYCGASFTFFGEATDINDNGWIVGLGQRNGNIRAFLMIPWDYCQGDIAGDALQVPDMVVDTSDIVFLLNTWESGVYNCLADVNGDGALDVSDLLLLLSNWGACPGSDAQVESFEMMLAGAGLTTDDWDEFEQIMTSGTPEEQANYNCWMQNYLMQCTNCPSCPDKDPFAD